MSAGTFEDALKSLSAPHLGGEPELPPAALKLSIYPAAGTYNVLSLHPVDESWLLRKLHFSPMDWEPGLSLGCSDHELSEGTATTPLQGLAGLSIAPVFEEPLSELEPVSYGVEYATAQSAMDLRWTGAPPAQWADLARWFEAAWAALDEFAQD